MSTSIRKLYGMSAFQQGTPIYLNPIYRTGVCLMYMHTQIRLALLHGRFFIPYPHCPFVTIRDGDLAIIPMIWEFVKDSNKFYRFSASGGITYDYKKGAHIFETKTKPDNAFEILLNNNLFGPLGYTSDEIHQVIGGKYDILQGAYSERVLWNRHKNG